MSGEFAALARVAATLPQPPAPEVGIGDDAAVLRAPGSGWTLWAADTVVASVHADLALTGLDDLGWKAVAVNVSDIAAMGGCPSHLLVTVAGPPGTDLDLLYRGIAEAAAEWGCTVAGGDLANAACLVVTVAITGWLPGPAILRSGAQPGDGIWVTGPLGLSTAGLRILNDLGKGAAGPGASGPGRLEPSVGRGAAGVAAGGSGRLERPVGPGAGEVGAGRSGRLEPSVGTVAGELAIERHRRPRPSVAAGLAARAAGASAMIDVSDGLAADLGHLADASGVGLEVDAVPVGEGATEEEALTGGEDYVLAFTAPDPAAVVTAFAGLPAPFRIGTCLPDAGVRRALGRPFPDHRGWEHEWR